MIRVLRLLHLHTVTDDTEYKSYCVVHYRLITDYKDPGRAEQLKCYPTFRHLGIIIISNACSGWLVFAIAMEVQFTGWCVLVILDVIRDVFKHHKVV